LAESGGMSARAIAAVSFSIPSFRLRNGASIGAKSCPLLAWSRTSAAAFDAASRSIRARAATARARASAGRPDFVSPEMSTLLESPPISASDSSVAASIGAAEPGTLTIWARAGLAFSTFQSPASRIAANRIAGWTSFGAINKTSPPRSPEGRTLRVEAASARTSSAFWRTGSGKPPGVVARLKR
jgi:hypothetical protein